MPFRHQVIEIPPIKPIVTEHQWQQPVCPTCGETMRAPWPEGVPSGTYGPRVPAMVALCTGSYSLVPAHHPAGDGRPVRCADACGGDQPVGEGYDGSAGSAC
jgi:hypothetical protein